MTSAAAFNEVRPTGEPARIHQEVFCLSRYDKNRRNIGRVPSNAKDEKNWTQPCTLCFQVLDLTLCQRVKTVVCQSLSHLFVVFVSPLVEQNKQYIYMNPFMKQPLTI